MNPATEFFALLQAAQPLDPLRSFHFTNSKGGAIINYERAMFAFDTLAQLDRFLTTPKVGQAPKQKAAA